ncbi:MAG TPA: hypothetical protein VIL89_07075 [Clostridia bacterium]
MKIISSSIQMSSVSTYSKTQSTVESMRMWADTELSSGSNSFNGVLIELSDQGKKFAQATQEVKPQDELYFELTEEDKEKIQLLSDFIYILTGKRLKFYVPKIRKNSAAKTSDINNPSSENTRYGWGISYRFSQTTHEEEHMSFQANGVVKTADGREINLDLKLNMDRTFTSYMDISFAAGDARIDPLVINLDRPSASFSAGKYEFDLNADGIMDSISFVDKGSGFLAYDKNKNGIIDNGLELFGPSSGNGFLELMEYDDDGNGWIDENDEIYNNLSIWIREDGSEPKLLALGQAGVGAIYLGHVASPFSLTDNNNKTQGVIQQTGIFLFENGLPGTIQHVDIAI